MFFVIRKIKEKPKSYIILIWIFEFINNSILLMMGKTQKIIDKDDIAD